MGKSQSALLLDAVDLCYAGVADAAAMQAAVELMGTAVGADAGDVISECDDTESSVVYGSFGFDPTFRADYDTQFVGNNPWLENLLRHPRGACYTEDADPTGFRDSAYFNEWVRPQGFLSTVGGIVKENGLLKTYVGFTRQVDRGCFNDRDISLVERFMPHMCRVITMQQQMGGVSNENATLLAAMDVIDLPLFALDCRGRVRFSNHAADVLLGAEEGICLTRNRRLSLRRTDLDNALQAKVHHAARVVDDAQGATAAEGNAPLIIRQGAGKALSLSITPLRGCAQFDDQACAIVSVTRLGTMKPVCAAPLADWCSLTQSEQSLAEILARGGALSDFSRQQNITIGTARWHLKNLESKTGTSRIEELVALVHAGGTPIR